MLSCSKRKELRTENQPDPTISVFEFGSKYGFCIGNKCYTSFSLSDEGLKKTTSSAIGTNKETISISDSLKIKTVMKVLAEMPLTIRQLKKDTVYGCPDCYDQGGIFVTIIRNETTPDTTQILFDNSIESNPKELQPYVLALAKALVKLNE